MNLGSLLLPVFLLHLLDFSAVAYTPLPRWGQAAAVINDALYVQGGMTDQYNSFSYTSAPITNDLLYLSLSSPFDASSPPWELLSTSSNSSVSHGPEVAWHTMSAYNISQMLIFGGFPSVNSPQVLTVQPDSAWLLDVLDRSNPIFTQEAQSWASEPIRRMRHSAITNRAGNVFIVGGEKADGSGTALSDHYVFDPRSPSFTQLPSDNGPGGITGHASVILPNGTMLVFGGYDQAHNQMVPFSSIWVLDTTADSYSWSTWSVSSANLPTPRRAFAYVLIDGAKILIQGGSNADFQTTYSDGWMLDLTQPLSWSQVSSLSQLGQRRDHFAVSYGSEVIFGFGYGPSGPASPPLSVYNPSGGSGGSGGSDGSYSSTYTPPSSTASLTQTIPVATETSGSGSGVLPSPSQGGGDGGGDGSGGGDGGGGSGGGNPLNPNGSGNKRTTAIAVGTIFGVIGALVVGIVIVYYVRRRRRAADEERRFLLLNEDFGRSSPHLEQGMQSTHALGEKYHFPKVFKNLKIGGALTAAPGGVVGLTAKRRQPERRDMLADEDTRQFSRENFDVPWYSFRRGSSWSLGSGLRGFKSRESSTSSYVNLSNPGTPWAEKNDPFTDGAAVMRDGETGYIGAAAPGHGHIARPSNRRDMSYGSSRSGSSYLDPFADPFADPEPQSYYTDVPAVSRVPSSRRPYPRPSQPLHVDTLLPISAQVHTLSPVTEASRGTISQSDHSHQTTSVSSHTNSNEHGGTLSPFDTTSGGTSISSTSMSPRPSSLIDSSYQNFQPIRRSDSWWARFSRTSLLDRRASGSRHGGMPEIRDPNPPPRLVAIEESQHSASPDNDSPKSARSNSIKRALSRGAGSKVYKGGHGKSLSSLRTADSEAIERMAGMDVAQRERTGSHGTRESSGTSYDNHSSMWSPEDGRGEVVHGVDMSFNSTSPVEMTNDEAAQILSQASSSRPPSQPSHKTTPSPPVIGTPPSAISSDSSVSSSASQRRSRRISGSAVAARVKAFEQLSMDDLLSPAPTNTRNREERRKKSPSVNYGLVPRASLFVANPDHGQAPSGDSATSS